MRIPPTCRFRPLWISGHASPASPRLSLRFSSRVSSPSVVPKKLYSRAATVVGLAAAGGLTAIYFFWPSKSCAAPTYPHGPISPSHFTPITLTASESCGPNLKLLTFTIPPESLPSPSESTRFWPIWSIFVKDDDIQVERPYTPLEGVDEHGNMKLWVKKYPNGEVGRWLHSKQVGDAVEIRGPLATFHCHEEIWDEIVMISGGTGFSPCYQLLHHELLKGNSPNRTTRFTVLHGSQSPAELPPPELLQPLVKIAELHPERLRLHLFVDSLGSSSQTPSSAYDMQEGRIDRTAIERSLGLFADDARSWWRRWSRSSSSSVKDPGFRHKNVLILVCGPESMIAAIAGPYGRNYSQGAVGGILGDLGFKSGQICRKLTLKNNPISFNAISPSRSYQRNNAENQQVLNDLMSSYAYEVALFGEFFSHDLKAILNRIALHSESAHQMHSTEIVFEPLDIQQQRDSGQEPVLLRAKKELLEPDSGWVLYSYLKPESVRVHPEATVRPWATVQVVGDALSFASALGYARRSQIYKRGYVFRRGPLIIQMFQQEQFSDRSNHDRGQVDPRTRQPIPSHADTLWEVEVNTASPVRSTKEAPLSQSIDAVLEVQLLMKGLLDLRRQDV